MPYYILKKENFDAFIKKLAKKRKVAAPVAKDMDGSLNVLPLSREGVTSSGNWVFEEVTSSEKIALDYISTILPPKKYFMPQKETMLDFDRTYGENAVANIEMDDMVIFGVHPCDLAGIQCLNMVFAEKPRDFNYLLRKSKITLIGLECNHACDESSICVLMNTCVPSGGYDMFFTDMGNKFVVHVNTQRGDDIIKETNLFSKSTSQDIAELDKLRGKKCSEFVSAINIEPQKIPEVFAQAWDSPVWEDVGKRCLACGNCTNVCPTCYCYDIYDEVNFDLKTGVRMRRWDSCQVETFAKVAGGENFRKERSERQRHRYYRKFKYPLEKYYRFFCTGCGRCTRTCMAKISLKETLKSLVEEYKSRERLANRE